MTKTIAALALLGLSILGLPLAARAQPESATQPLAHRPGSRNASRTALVQAVVDSIGPSQKDTPFLVSTQRITHVYCGPQEWVGRTFLIWPSGPISGLGNPFPTRVQLNGVYIVSGDKRMIGHDFIADGRVYGIRGIIFETQTKEYAGALKLAQEVEKVCQATPEAQLTMLRDLVGSPTPEVEVWAIRELGARALAKSTLLPDPKAKALLVPLLPKIVSTQGKIAYDEAMSWQDGVLLVAEQTWRTSPARLDLFQALLRAGTPQDIDLALVRVLEAIYDKSMNGHDAFTLASEALKSPRTPDQTRENMTTQILSELANRELYDADSIFNFLVDVLKSNAPLSIRVAVFPAFYRFALSAEQVQTLTQLQLEVTDLTLKKDLADVLAYLQKKADD